MSRLCPECGNSLRHKATRCPCGWRGADDKSIAINPRHGLCEFNDHGQPCPNHGTVSLHTGAGGPWYCTGHALGMRGLVARRTKNGLAPIKAALQNPMEAADDGYERGFDCK